MRPPVARRIADPGTQAARRQPGRGLDRPPGRPAGTVTLAQAAGYRAVRRRREPGRVNDRVEVRADQLSHLGLAAGARLGDPQQDPQFRVDQDLRPPRLGLVSATRPPGHHDIDGLTPARLDPAADLQPRALQQPGRAQQPVQRRLGPADPGNFVIGAIVFVVFIGVVFIGVVRVQLPGADAIAAGLVVRGAVPVALPRRDQHRRPVAHLGGQRKPRPVGAIQQANQARLTSHHAPPPQHQKLAPQDTAGRSRCRRRRRSGAGAGGAAMRRPLHIVRSGIRQRPARSASARLADLTRCGQAAAARMAETKEHADDTGQGG